MKVKDCGSSISLGLLLTVQSRDPFQSVLDMFRSKPLGLCGFFFLPLHNLQNQKLSMLFTSFHFFLQFICRKFPYTQAVSHFPLLSQILKLQGVGGGHGWPTLHIQGNEYGQFLTCKEWKLLDKHPRYFLLRCVYSPWRLPMGLIWVVHVVTHTKINFIGFPLPPVLMPYSFTMLPRNHILNKLLITNLYIKVLSCKNPD